MKLIAITPENTLTGEHDYIRHIFESGFDYVHIRKPSFGPDDMREYLSQIPDKYYPRLTLHSLPGIASAMGIGGIHLNSRMPVVPTAFSGKLSRSCHTLREIEPSKITAFEYVFLSPIFDSISKTGYMSTFAPGQLDEASHRGIINSRIVALGGMTSQNMRFLKKWNFGGAAFLGYLFNSANIAELDVKLNQIQNSNF